MWCGALFPEEICSQIGAFVPRRCIRKISRTHHAGKSWAKREMRRRSMAFVCTHSGTGDEGGGVHAFRPSTGEEMWSQTLRHGSTCTPASDEMWLYTCDHVGKIEARNMETGLLRWSRLLRMEVAHTHLMLYRGKLLVRTLRGVLVCLCSRTGKETWRTSPPHPCYPLHQMYDTAPVRSSSGKMVYYIDSVARLIGISMASGEPCWEDSVGSCFPHARAQAKGVPIVGKGYIWLMYSVDEHLSGNGPHEYVVCLASNTRRPVWFRYAGFDRCCLRLASTTQLLITDLEGGLSALNPATGNTLWCFHTDYSISVGTPETSPAVQGLLFVVDTGTTLFALNAQDGTCRWRAALPHAISSPPVYVSGLVLVASETSGIFAHDARDGTLVWHRDLSSVVHFCRPLVV